ncbi:OFA family MFS transporter [Gottschalkiaceae bacterium SANA]|nr:OFA family MFS transporter [Gottschalkiaceae bacterium SANA]
MENIKTRRWLYLLTAIIVLLFMGIGYAFSLFVIPIEKDLGFLRTQTSMAFSLCFISFALGSFTGGFIIQKVKPQSLMKIVAMTLSFGFIATTFVTHAWQLYFTYSMCCGFSIGVIYNVCVSVIPLYFQDKIGFATGVLLMGYAMSTTIFGQICEYGVTILSWQGVFRILGVSMFAILMIASFIIHFPSSREINTLPKSNKTAIESIDYTPVELVKSKTFYIFISIYILLGGIGMSIINHTVPALREDFLLTTTFTAAIFSAISLFNGLGRVVWGILFDKTGASFIYRSLGGLVSIALLLMVFSFHFQNWLSFAVGGACVMFCFGGSSSLAPILVRYLYGDQYFSMNFSITNIGTLILSTTPMFIGSIQMRYDQYFPSFVVLLFFGILALLASLLYKPIASRELQKY